MNKGMPCVTVSLPVFNGEDLLSGAVASVQAQTFGDFELIIIDDGSTDNTLSVARRLADKDSRIRVVTQPNSGSCVARNRGFKEARGEFVATIDSDDFWPSYRLEEQLEILRSNPGCIVIGGVQRFRVTEEGQEFGVRTDPFRWKDKEDYLKRLIQAPDRVKVLINTMMAPRDYILEDHWDPGFRTGHDWEAWIRLATKHPFVHAERIYQFYRKHSASTTGNHRLRMVIDCHAAVIEKHGLAIMGSNAEKNRVLRRRFLTFANDSLYLQDAANGFYCLKRAFNAGAGRESLWFYRLMLNLMLLRLGLLKAR